MNDNRHPTPEETEDSKRRVWEKIQPQIEREARILRIRRIMRPFLILIKLAVILHMPVCVIACVIITFATPPFIADLRAGLPFPYNIIFALLLRLAQGG